MTPWGMNVPIVVSMLAAFLEMLVGDVEKVGGVEVRKIPSDFRTNVPRSIAPPWEPLISQFRVPREL